MPNQGNIALALNYPVAWRYRIAMLGMMLLSRVMGGGMALARAELTGPSLSRLRPRRKKRHLHYG